MSGQVNCPVSECFAGQAGSWAINRPTLDRHPLLAQGDTFLHRVLDGVDADPHATVLYHALADLQLLLVDRNNLFLVPGAAVVPLGVAVCRCTSHAALPGWTPDQPDFRHWAA
jgi:hypothetical protein